MLSVVILRAVEAPVAERVDLTGYARAFCHLASYIAQVERPEPGGRAPKMTVKPQREGAPRV
jgi:hypothetical protein